MPEDYVMEQAAPASEQSIESRLAAVLGAGKPEAAPAAEPAVESAQAEEAVDESQVDDPDHEGEVQADEPDFVDVSDDDGNTHKVPAKLRDAFERKADYTRKTQEVATLRRQAEDKLHFAQAREQILGDVVQDIVGLKQKEDRLEQFKKLDWESLYNANPGQALNLKAQMDSLNDETQRDRATIQDRVSRAEAARRQHAETQWSLAVKGARERIGSLTPAEDIAMSKIVADMGFSQDETHEKLADPRILHLVHMAAKYQALSHGKADAVKTAQKAPPVVKPGAAVHGAATENRYKEARARLTRSGSVDDAARLLVLRGRSRS